MKNFSIDGIELNNNNLRSWQKSIGYVPQYIYLSDDTLASNIAFGIDPSNINEDAIEKSSKIANLHDFVINELPNKYQTLIGERGVRCQAANVNVLELQEHYITILKF